MSSPKLVIVDVSAAKTSSQLHQLLASSFSFPDYYGGNWDAFHDCITTLDPMPEKIVVQGLKTLFERLPLEVELLTDVLADAQKAPDLSHVEIHFE